MKWRVARVVHSNRSSRFFRRYLLPVFLFGAGCLLGAVAFKYKGGVLKRLTDARQQPESTLLEPSGMKTVSTVATTLTRLTKTVLVGDGSLELVGYGGGLAAVRGGCLGVDSRGQFFVYRSGGAVQTLDLSLDFNLPEYEAFIDGKGYSDWWRSHHGKNVAVQGIAARERGGAFELYVCHDKWLMDEKAKVTVLSRLTFGDLEETLEGRLQVGPEQWETVCEIGPAFPFEEKQQRPFTSNHRGGRIVFYGDGDLLLTVGDHRLNGLNDPIIASQDPDLWQGKILKIDPSTGDLSVFASGTRNAQGLMIDRDGVVWETEHGPNGGDELNRLVEGENYGWPLVTLGTDYGSFEWPLSKEQGRHEGFAAPVFAWLPSIAVSNLLQVQDVPSAWDGDLLVSSLLAQSLFRVRLDGGSVSYVEQIPVGERIRDLAQLEDGTILLWTDAGRVLELTETPESEALFSEPLTERERSRGLGSVLNRCSSCHDLRPERSLYVAPSLWQVFGRKIGSTYFSEYSPALKSKQGVWDERSLRLFLTDPQSFAPGTTMPPVGMDEDSVELLVSYLRRLR